MSSQRSAKAKSTARIQISAAQGPTDDNVWVVDEAEMREEAGETRGNGQDPKSLVELAGGEWKDSMVNRLASVAKRFF